MSVRSRSPGCGQVLADKEIGQNVVYLSETADSPVKCDSPGTGGVVKYGGAVDRIAASSPIFITFMPECGFSQQKCIIDVESFFSIDYDYCLIAYNF